MEKEFPMKKISLSVLAVLFVSGLTYARPSQMKVIYGEDNRKDVFESTDSALVELSRSTAAMIPASNLKKTSWFSDELIISGRTLQERGICAKERFSKQISAANCSGFIVSDKLLVTAGHCIKSESDCEKWKWVFDYKVEHSEQGSIKSHKDNVFSCKRIVERTLGYGNGDDYALIELDRAVPNRRPLAFRRSGKIELGAAVAVIGHPTGLPTKITDGAVVRKLAGPYFVTNLDTYGGNSGSAVFNLKTLEVEGILVRGETDYKYDNSVNCQVSNLCTDTGCRGEDVTYITNIKALQNL